MKINYIKFKNYRQYIDNEFNMENGNKFIHVATNGVGKSTFRHGVLIALYGKEALKEQLFEDITIRDYRNLLSNYREKGGTTSFTIEFTIKNTGFRYILKRSFDFTMMSKTPNCNSTLIVEENNLVEKKVTNENEILNIVEDIMPLQLSKFFIFDGEILSNLNSGNGYKNDIERLLNIDKYLRRIDILKLALNNFQHQLSGGKTNESEVRSTVLQIDKLNSQISITKKNILGYEDRIPPLTKEYNELHSFISKQKETKELQSKIDTLSNTIDYNAKQCQSTIEKMYRDLYTDDFFNFQLKDFYQQVKLKLNLEETNGISGIDAKAIDYIIKNDTCICGTTLDSTMIRKLEELRLLVPPHDLSALNREVYDQIKRENNLDYSYNISSCEESSILQDQQNSELQRLKKDLAATNTYEDKVSRFHDVDTQRTNFIQELGAQKRNLDILTKSLTNEEIKLTKMTSQQEENIINLKKIDFINEMIEKNESQVHKIQNELLPHVEISMKKKLRDMGINTQNFAIKKDYSLQIQTNSTGEKVIANFSYLTTLIEEITLLNGKNMNAKFPLILDAPTSAIDARFISELITLIEKSGSELFINIFYNAYESFIEAYNYLNIDFSPKIFNSIGCIGTNKEKDYQWIDTTEKDFYDFNKDVKKLKFEDVKQIREYHE